MIVPPQNGEFRFFYKLAFTRETLAQASGRFLGRDRVPGPAAAFENLCIGDLPDRRETIPPSMKPAYSSPVGNVLVVPVKKIMGLGEPLWENTCTYSRLSRQGTCAEVEELIPRV